MSGCHGKTILYDFGTSGSWCPESLASTGKQQEYWSCGDPEMDAWVASEQFPAQVLQDLAALDAYNRTRVVRSVHAHRNDARNMVAYFHGSIKKQLGKERKHDSPYSRPVARPLSNGSNSSMGRSFSSDSSQREVGVANLLPAFGMSQVSSSQRTERSVLARGSGNIPSWILGAADQLFKHESGAGFMTAKTARLSQASLELLGVQPPEMQYHVLTSLLFARKDWQDPDAFVKQALSTLTVLQQGASNQSIPAEPCLPGPIIKLAVLHNCAGIGTSHLVLMGALQRIKRRGTPDYEFQLVCNASFEVDVDAVKVEKALSSNVGSLVILRMPRHLSKRTWNSGDEMGSKSFS